MKDLIAVVSYIMAVVGGLAVMLSANRDRQTVGAIVGFAFLISFFISVPGEAQLVLRGACLIAFAVAVLGGAMTIFTREADRRTGAIMTGVVALATSILILFAYVQFP